MQHIVNRARTFLRAQIAMESAIRASDSTPTQYALLMAVSTENLTTGHLGDTLGLACSTLTPLIDRMEFKGLIVRNRSTTDRRVITVEITPKGQAVLDQVNAALTPLFEDMPLEVTEWLVAVPDSVARQMAAV